MIKLHRGDCLEYLKQMPDKSIDCIIMDPPYLQEKHPPAGSLGGKYKSYFSNLTNISGGFSEEILFECDRVLKRINIYAFCNKKQLKFYLDHYNRRDVNFDLISWHKSNPIPATNNIYLRDTEYIVFFRQTGVKLYGDYSTKHTYYVSPYQKSKLHPVMKPLELVKRFVINSSVEGDTVMDPFMGSGTTGVACVELGRNFIGCEIDKKYFKTAKERIIQAKCISMPQ